MLFVVIFLVLGLAFGFAAGWPWGLLAFLIPIGLALAASDRSVGAIVLYFAVTAIGVVGGLALAARTDREQHA
jgi:hypothetical protein